MGNVPPPKVFTAIGSMQTGQLGFALVMEREMRFFSGVILTRRETMLQHGFFLAREAARSATEYESTLLGQPPHRGW